MNENHELLLELWSRIKSHVPPKARLEVADTLLVVFDEFSMVTETLLEEDLDKELRAAAKSHLSVISDDDEEIDDDYGE